MFNRMMTVSVVKNCASGYLSKCLSNRQGFRQSLRTPSCCSFPCLSKSNGNQLVGRHFSTDPAAAGEKMVCERLDHSKENTLHESDKEQSKNPLFENINYHEIAGTDEALMQQLHRTIEEMQKMEQQNHCLPTNLRLDQWHELLHLHSYMKKVRFLRFVFVKNLKRKRDKENKVKRRELKEGNRQLQAKELSSSDYVLGKNTFFLRIYPNHMDKFRNFKALLGMMFEPTIVIDCSYDTFMVPQETASCAKQLLQVFSGNRLSDVPLNIHYCNFNPESNLAKKLTFMIPTLFDDDFPFHWTSKSYTEVYPKEKLVYLTPHCSETLTTFSGDYIYIIGAMVDKRLAEPFSLVKAQEAGIRCAKLPLDDYLDWGSGSKSLTVNQCAGIMQGMHLHGSWEKALADHVPRRKLFKSDEEMLKAILRRPTDGSNLKLSSKRNMALYDHLVLPSNEEFSDVGEVKDHELN